MNIEDYISSGVIEAYVMGLATEEETQILECVQKNNAVVRQAVSEARETLGRLHQAQAVSPPAHLKSAIWSKIQADSASEAEPVPLKPLVVKSKSAFLGKSFYRAAASLFFVLFAGIFAYSILERQRMQAELNALTSDREVLEKSLAVLNEKWGMSSDPDIRTIPLAGVEKHPDSRAVVYLNSRNKKTYLSLENLPEAPSGYQYQLWGLVNGTPVSAGVFSLEDRSKFQEMLAVANAQAYAITLEKEGGSAAPTLEEMYVMGSI